MKFFKLELKRLINDKIFISILMLNTIFYVYINFKMNNIHFISDNNFYLRLFFLSPDTIELTNILYFVLPIICSLVGGDVLARDVRSKHSINMVSRKNKRKYMLTKAVIAFLSAGIVVIVPFLLDFFIKLAIYPINLPSAGLNSSFQDIIGMSDIFVYHPMIYTIIALLFTFLFSGLFGLIGFTVSIFTHQKLIITAVPFLLTIVAWNLVNMLGIKNYLISSVLIFRITQNIYTLKEVSIVFLIPFIITVLISIIRGKNYDFM